MTQLSKVSQGIVKMCFSKVFCLANLDKSKFRNAVVFYVLAILIKVKSLKSQFSLTQFRMGGQKVPAYQFFPCNFYERRSLNVGNQLLKLSDFQFQPFFHTGVKFQGYTQSQSQSQFIEIQPTAPLKKLGFSGQILTKSRL